VNKLLNKYFIEVTKNIFNKLFDLNIEPGDIYSTTNDNHKWDISGMVGVAGDLEGIISIRLKENHASEILKKTRIDTPDVAARWELVNDMIGELVNNISGNTLSKLTDTHFRVSVPITIQGENHILKWPDNAPIVAIPFTVDDEDFEVQYSLYSE